MHANDAVSLSMAAARLAALGDPVDRTTLSRYVKSHAIPTIRQGRENLVSFAALVEHRRTNELLGPGAHNLPVMNGAAPAMAAQPETGYPASPAAPTKSDGQSRKWAADAAIRELDLARQTQQLVEVAKVRDGAGDAIAAMETAMLGSLNQVAEAMAEEFRVEPRRVRQRLRQMVDEGLARFRAQMEALISAEG